MLKPASTVIEICGGVGVVSEITGRGRSVVHRWTYPKARGGTGGLIPSDVQSVLLRAARLRGIDLLPEHFFETEDLPFPLPALSGREDAA